MDHQFAPRHGPHRAVSRGGFAASPGAVAHTFSICAVDPETGEAGVAVASRALAVGAMVPYATPHGGAIAIQGCVVPEYGTLGVRWLARGAGASTVMQRLIQRDLPATAADDEQANALFHQEGMCQEGDDFLSDPANQRIVWFGERVRQVGIVDRHGVAAVHQGARLQPCAAARVGEGFACLGNALTGPEVVDAMALAYEQARKADGAMDASLMAALRAGVDAGGDRRGTRAAALLVVRDRGHWTGSDRYRDLRVDDDPQPVAKLAAIFAQF